MISFMISEAANQVSASWATADRIMRKLLHIFAAI
jgi:hypothetical protein